MAATSSNPSPSLRRSTRKATLLISTTSIVPPLSPFSEVKRPDLPPAARNAFSSLRNSSIEWGVKMTGDNAGDLNHNAGFTKEQFEALCDKQRNDSRGKGKTVEGATGELRSPSQVVEMWSPRSEQNLELADEVNEWIEFLPYGDGTRKTGSAVEGEENMALALCKWILTKRSQNESGQWTYVDRQATREEILSFKEKGWPWYR